MGYIIWQIGGWLVHHQLKFRHYDVITIIDGWGLKVIEFKVGRCISMFATDHPAYLTKSALSHRKGQLTKQMQA